MKILKIESAAEIELRSREKGTVKVTFEIPYPETTVINPSEENIEWFDDAKKVLRDMGEDVSQNEDVFTQITQKSYGPLAKQIVNYLAATLTVGISGMEILSLLEFHIEQARKEAIEVVEKNSKNAEKWS